MFASQAAPPATRWRRAHSKFGMMVLSIVLFVALTGCSDDSSDDTDPDSSSGSWQRLDLAPAWVTALELTPDHLAISGGVSGVYVQSPPLDGAITFAGSDFPDLLGDLSYGVYALASADDSLYRGFRGPVNHIPVECGSLEPPYESIPCSAGITPGRINDMMALSNGDLLLVTSESVYRKAAGHMEWELTDGRRSVSAAFSRGGVEAIFLVRVFGAATLYGSTDNGAHWTFIPVTWPAGFESGDIRSIATTATGDTVLVGSGSAVLLSTNRGASFSVLRNVGSPAVVRIEPSEPFRCLALADSLYESADLGATWSARSLPGRPLMQVQLDEPTIPMDVSWESNTCVIGRLGNDNAEVWSCEID